MHRVDEVLQSGILTGNEGLGMVTMNKVQPDSKIREKDGINYTMNAISKKQSKEILEPFAKRLKARMPQKQIRIGVSSQVHGIGNLHIAYKRAMAAVRMTHAEDDPIIYFDKMGMYRLLYSVEDKALLQELSGELLKPLLDYDTQHHADYVETLECFLNNSGSIKAVSEQMFIHRNTILYRMTNIKNLLDCSLESAEDRMKYKIACMIQKMNVEDSVI